MYPFKGQLRDGMVKFENYIKMIHKYLPLPLLQKDYRNAVLDCSGCYKTELGWALPTQSEANLLTLGCGEGKHTIYCKVPCMANGQLMT